MYIYVIDGSNWVRNRVNNRVLWSGYGVFAPLETRSGHGAEKEQPAGAKKKK